VPVPGNRLPFYKPETSRRQDMRQIPPPSCRDPDSSQETRSPAASHLLSSAAGVRQTRTTGPPRVLQENQTGSDGSRLPDPVRSSHGVKIQSMEIAAACNQLRWAVLGRRSTWRKRCRRSGTCCGTHISIEESQGVRSLAEAQQDLWISPKRLRRQDARSHDCLSAETWKRSSVHIQKETVSFRL
jgi:hypothetical protein